jgi:uncharacterized hydrophobic protein (TIGR00271 family)
MNDPSRILNIKALFDYIRFKLRLPRDPENIQLTIDSVKNGSTMTGANLWVLVMAIFTASLGLNVNSTAVIIGAMLISPLMGPIMAVGMGVAIYDFKLVQRSLKNFFLAFGISITASTLFFLLSPLKGPGSELLARTSPTIYDVLIAIFGGLAGIIAGSSKLRQSNVIPGVAIATALMPPLCTVGFGIATLNAAYVIGALYLFFINSVFISLSTFFIVTLLKYPKVELLHERKALRLRRMIWAVVLVALLPSIYLTVQIVKKYVFEQRANSFVRETFKEDRRVVLLTETIFSSSSQQINLTIIGPEIDSLEMLGLKDKMKVYGLGNSGLNVRQGYGDVTRKSSFMGNISSTMENNSRAINEIYKQLDSLLQPKPVAIKVDSLQAGIAREAFLWLPDMGSFYLDSISYYDIGSGQTRKGWEVNIYFKKRPARTELTKLRNWLQTKLAGDTLIINSN